MRLPRPVLLMNEILPRSTTTLGLSDSTASIASSRSRVSGPPIKSFFGVSTCTPSTTDLSSCTGPTLRPWFVLHSIPARGGSQFRPGFRQPRLSHAVVGIDGQSLLERLHGPALVILSCQGLSQEAPRIRVLGIDRRGLAERGDRLIEISSPQVQETEPPQRGSVLRLELPGRLVLDQRGVQGVDRNQGLPQIDATR